MAGLALTVSSSRAPTAFNNIDQIQDFSTGAGDKINIADVLSGHYDPVHDTITDFVQITTVGSDSVLKVDLDGTGPAIRGRRSPQFLESRA
jgi:hypothetical protein